MNAPSLPRIAIDPEICGGRPTIAGRRTRVEDVLAALAEGASEAELLADFPDFTAADVRVCLAFAATLAKSAGHPASGTGGSAMRIPPGTYTLETLPPPSEGARAILASVDSAAAVSLRADASVRRPDGSPGRTLEDEGAPGISL